MLKKLIKLFIILLVLWLIILVVNIFRINNYKKPIVYSWVLEDESTATYNCLGYQINTAKIRGIILRADMYFGNYKVFETEKREYEYDPVTDTISIIDFINGKKCYSEYFCEVPVTGKINISWTDSPQNYQEALEKVDIAFTCKVNRIKDTIYRNPVRINLFTVSYDPYTIYEVEVLENIKGNTEINSILEVMQLGGINKNKKTATLVEDIEMLEENCYYKLYPIKIELEEIEYLDITNPFRVEKVNYK